MSQVGKFLQFIFSHKKKYFVFILAFVVFVFLLFPYQDVGDVVTSFIAKNSQNQIYVAFSNLNPSLFPSLQVEVDDVSVEMPAMPPVSAQHIKVQPSWGALLTQKPDGKLIAKGIFKGDVELEIHPGKKNEAGNTTHNLQLSAERLSLSELHKIANLPILLKGQTTIKAVGHADLTFQDQPDFDIDLKVDKFELPSSSVETQFGPVQLPQIRLSQVELKGRLSAGRFQIEKALAGKNGDDLFANIKGGLNFQVQNRSGQMVPIFGAYQIDIDMTLQKSLFDKLSAFLSPLDNYRVGSPENSQFIQYRFKLNATSFEYTPNISALR